MGAKYGRRDGRLADWDGHSVTRREVRAKEGADYFYRFQADGYGLADQTQDILRVVAAIGVVGDAAAFVG